MFADLAAADAAHIKDFLIIGIAISSMVLGWLGYARSGRNQVRTIEPQPVEVKVADGHVTTAECANRHAFVSARVDRVERAIEEIRVELRADRVSLDASDEARASRIHQRIDQVQAEMNEKIQELPAQIVTLLRNTGALK